MAPSAPHIKRRRSLSVSGCYPFRVTEPTGALNNHSKRSKTLPESRPQAQRIFKKWEIKALSRLDVGRRNLRQFADFLSPPDSNVNQSTTVKSEDASAQAIAPIVDKSEPRSATPAPHCTPQNACPSAPDSDPIEDKDSYPLSECSSADLIGLLDEVENRRPQIPSTVLMREFAPSSSNEVHSCARSVYDPKLRHSPPVPLTEQGQGQTSKDTISTKAPKPSTQESEDLLSSDVDWDEVIAVTNPSRLPPPQKQQQQQATPNPIIQPQTSTGITIAASPGERRPFLRPPFPPPLQPRSPITGLSSSPVLRICFRIAELLRTSSQSRQAQLRLAAVTQTTLSQISPTTTLSPPQDDLIFELFARVTYSSREMQSRVQHFQFLDLFKDQPPHPTGTLTNWRVGGVDDRRSSVFLRGTSRERPRRCRCVCRVVRCRDSVIGWAFRVLSIREMGWEEVGFVRSVVVRDM